MTVKKKVQNSFILDDLFQFNTNSSLKIGFYKNSYIVHGSQFLSLKGISINNGSSHVSHYRSLIRILHGR